MTVQAGTAYRKIWRLVNSFFARLIRFTGQKFQLFWVIFCVIIFFIELWHILIVISQNAKWGHAGFYIDCHRMTVPENMFLQKKHCIRLHNLLLIANLRPWCGQPSDQGRQKNRTEQPKCWQNSRLYRHFQHNEACVPVSSAASTRHGRRNVTQSISLPGATLRTTRTLRSGKSSNDASPRATAIVWAASVTGSSARLNV